MSSESHRNSDQIYVHDTGLLMLPDNHPEFTTLLRLQLENLELAQWKSQLQSRIVGERNEIVRLQEILKNCNLTAEPPSLNEDLGHEILPTPDEEAIAYLLKKNSLLEKKKTLLGREIYDQNIELIQLQVELAVRTFKV